MTVPSQILVPTVPVVPDLIPAIGLIRQSDEKESKLSPDTQAGGIAAYADTHSMAVIKMLEELDTPGDAFRPKLEQAIAMVEAGEAKAVILWKLDRLGREPEGIYSARGRIERAGGKLCFADEDFDLDSESGDYLFAMFAARAKAERRRIKANWKRATTAASARGVHQGGALRGRGPYGYDRPEVAKGALALPLTVNAQQAEGIRMIFTMRADQKSYRAISDALLAAGHKPVRAKAWTPNALSHIIANTAYLGTAKQGKLVHEDAHPAIVSQALYAAANAVRGTKAARTADYLLSGLCRCQGCRYRLAGQSGANERRSYRCKGVRGAGVCGHPARINADAIEAHVVAAVHNRHDLLMESAVKSLDIEALDAAVREAEAGVRTIASALATSSTPDLLLSALTQAEGNVIAAREERGRAMALYAPEGVGMVFRLRDEWEGYSTEQRKAAIRSIVEFVIIHRDGTVVVVWRGQDKALGPVPRIGGNQGVRKGERNLAMMSIVPFGWPIFNGEEGPVRVGGFERALEPVLQGAALGV